MEQNLALKDLEIMRLRKALDKIIGHDMACSVIAKQALSTPTTYDDLLAWHEVQLGEPEAWKYTKRDGEPTATLNKDFAFIVMADGFDVTPLYKLKD